VSTKRIPELSSFSNTRRLAKRRTVRASSTLLLLAVCWCAVVIIQRNVPSATPQAQAASVRRHVPTNSLLPGSQVIQHVVIIFQENRSTDNLFQDPVLIQRGADIQSYGINSHHEKITLGPRPMDDYYDMGHGIAQFVAMYDNGKMDGANKIAQHCDPGHGHCKQAPPNFQFKYVQPSDVGPYFQMAEQYTFADRMFETQEGPSYEAHQFIIAGTSAPSANSNLFADSVPRGGSSEPGAHTGCTAPPTQRVDLINPLGQPAGKMFPCFEHPTLGDLLDAQQLGWRYYTAQLTGLLTGPNSIRHVRFGPDWKKYVVLGPSRVLTDISAGKLAAVTWVIPNWDASDHPALNNGSGPSWVASVVNAIGGSQFWGNTAIFITWDDWGGFYDHVAPAVIHDGKSWGSGYVYGFRVPMIVVSPYAQTTYISHVTHDFGSILKFTEEVFGLPSLGYADAYADDLSDCFNFGQRPVEFRKISAPLDADYFLNDRQPLGDADDE
jgi:phospholipase C